MGEREWPQTNSTVGDPGDVLEIESVDPKAARSGWAAMEEPGEDKDQQEGSVVERRDAQDAPYIEVAPPVRDAFAVPQDSGDEETGENEEKGNAAPSGFEGQADGAPDRIGGLRSSAGVERDHDQDGESADAIEGWKVLTALYLLQIGTD